MEFEEKTVLRTEIYQGPIFKVVQDQVELPEDKSQAQQDLIFHNGAMAVIAELGHDLLPTSAYTFANGETYVRFKESVRGADAFVIQSHPAPINEWLMEQMIMIDALKRASARSITVVSPFYPYARQDKKHKGREPISARLIADLYKTAGADRLMCGRRRGRCRGG